MTLGGILGVRWLLVAHGRFTKGNVSKGAAACVVRGKVCKKVDREREKERGGRERERQGNK